ncbi:MAG: hypothetical protein PHV59_07895 [Victivallales bacterium]|nr:hypothetical protein [Victivallales bacterium]
MGEEAAKSGQDILKIPEQTFIDEYLGVRIHLREEKHIGIKTGQLEMEFKLSADDSELLMRNRYSDMSRLLKNEFESGWSKTSWNMQTGFLTFALQLPDRPVVLRPDVPQKITPGQRVSAYCSIPLMIEVSLNNARLEEYPTVILSKTWFGEPDNGVSGYSLKSQIVSSPDKLSRVRMQAQCSLEIENRSSELLCFDRLCLRTEYMSLFKTSGKAELTTSQCRLVYAGKERVGRISYHGPSRKVAKIISMPRLKEVQNLLFKSFQTV